MLTIPAATVQMDERFDTDDPVTKVLRTQGATVPKGSRARRKHPHFTDAELVTVASLAWTLGHEKIHFKTKAALLARGSVPKRRAPPKG